MTTINTIEELDNLPTGARVSLGAGEDVLTKCGDGEWRGGPYALPSGTAWHGAPDDPADYLPVVLLHPRVVTEAEVEVAARALASHASGGVCRPDDPDIEWRGWAKDVEVALTALGFEVQG